MTKEYGKLLLRRAFIVLLPLCGWLGAANQAKNFAQGSETEVERLLNDSPWSQRSSAVLDDPGDRREPMPVALPTASQAGLPGTQPSTPAGGRWDGGVGRSRMGRLPTIPVLIRWDSAATVREALARDKTPLSAEILASALKDYIITVVGLVAGNQYHSSGNANKASVSDDSKDVRDPEEILEAFMGSSKLRSRNGFVLQPENVKLEPETGAVHIFFSRTQPFTARDKEVVFSTRFGAMSVQAKFRLKEMTSDGKLDL